MIYIYKYIYLYIYIYLITGLVQRQYSYIIRTYNFKVSVFSVYHYCNDYIQLIININTIIDRVWYYNRILITLCINKVCIVL